MKAHQADTHKGFASLPELNTKFRIVYVSSTISLQVSTELIAELRDEQAKGAAADLTLK